MLCLRVGPRFHGMRLADVCILCLSVTTAEKDAAEAKDKKAAAEKAQAHLKKQQEVSS